MTALLIGPDERAAIAEALALARSRPIPMAFLAEHHVEPEDHVMSLERRGAEIDRPPSTTVILPRGYAASISFEEQPPGLCKHLSVGVNKAGALPNREAFWMIAAEFGIEQVAVASYWVEEYKPGFFAINVVALDVGAGGHA